MRTHWTYITLLTLSATALMAQEKAGGWRKATEADTAAAQATPPAPAPKPEPEPTASARLPLDAFGQPRGTAPSDPPRTQSPGTYNVPPELTVRPGTFISVRIDQELSSNRNLAGDSFSGTLTKPIVVDGFVIARRGQTIAGRVVEAVKSGRVKGTSRLGIELTELTLVDGQQVRFRSQLAGIAAPGSAGRDLGAVATTTAIGALAGAAADYGTGAAIGAAAGAGAGLIGVFLTRGRAGVIEPESVLTFRVEAPLTISTARSSHAFLTVEPRDHERDSAPRYQARQQVAYPVWWGGPGYFPPYWGPTIGFYYGRGWGRWSRGWHGPGWWW